MAIVITLLLVALVFGLVWLYRAARRPAAGTGEPVPAQSSSLSESTLAILQRLESPVNVRFYSVLDPATTSESLSAFADRVEQLLSAYQQASEGKIKVTRLTSQSNLKANAAPADGIQVFNLDKGEPCYLGIALEYKGRKDALPRLSPEWEQALEPDLTRALARLVDVTQPVPPPVAISQVNTAAVQEVRTLIPNVAAVSVEEGTKILREAALKDFKAVTKEMETQIKEAEQALVQARNGGSEAAQQAALKHLQEVQAAQTEKLKDIAAKSQAQVEAFQQLKAAAR